jgi:hypothetical protein
MVNVIFTQSNEIFNKFDVPRFKYCHQWFCDNRFPMGLEFEKTYYKRTENGLIAFRVLAYTLYDISHPYTLTYLVQLPNEQPRWINDFIAPNTKIYASAEDYILSGGTQSVDLRWINIYQASIGCSWRNYNDRYFFKGTFYTIKNGVVCESTGHYCNNLFVSKNGWLVQIAKRNLEAYHGEQGVYMSKADAMKVLLKDMTITDFAEDPISIDITIRSNTPKYTKVMIVE